MGRERKRLEVWAIVNAEGHYATGHLINGMAEFSPKVDDAMQLDAEERDMELKQAYMPEGATAKLLMVV